LAKTKTLSFEGDRRHNEDIVYTYLGQNPKTSEDNYHIKYRYITYYVVNEDVDEDVPDDSNNDFIAIKPVGEASKSGSRVWYVN